MRITIQQSILHDRLSHICKAVNDSPTIPILEGVKIDARGTLTLTGTDMHFSATTTLSDYIEDVPGVTVIPAHKLAEVVAKLPKQEVTIEVKDGAALITCGKKKVTLPALDAEDYPKLDQGDGQLLPLSTEDFVLSIKQTFIAVSTSEQTPQLTGINYYLLHGVLNITATDRHRMARQSIKLEDIKEHINRTIPAKSLLEVAKAAAKGKVDGIDLVIRDSRAYVTAGDYSYSLRLLDGTYPDTSKIVPSGGEHHIIVGREELLNAVELGAKVADGKTLIIKLSVADDELTISAQDEGANMSETLPALYKGEGVKLSLNAKYFIDALKAISSKRVEVYINSAMQPLLIYPEQDRESLHLILPYRTTG
ncbi:DNA polymerase III subunit beta [Paenibacillus sp. 598K]|uniref:DNA polymerase III subunit beta n=1 Tax=Paenibacillus sp. 598K TaxID=1117987 RepID=UPI000FFAFFD8|nr:DNA polymerase III subunit beta [Paenibacillus sp. 598K]GBF73140.1 DNA polymerase III subunit beta [Paenibacillus sp. 598K]